ncbi:MAG: SdpI family protein [Treponema sp.]|nr:SdpI family protein [Treponema sp.]
MTTENKKGFPIILIITSIICLLPICLSLAMYNELPEQAVMQWGIDETPNWYAHKAVIAFLMPVFFVVLNAFIFFIVRADSMRKNISRAMLLFVDLMIPVLSLIIVPIMLFMNLGVNLPIKIIIFCLVGVIFIFIGNYLPKNRQNVTAGIRITWTLNNAENWNKTHRLGGVLFIIGGLLFIVTAFLPLPNIIGIIIILAILLIMVITPILYSFILYKKEKNN